MQVHPAAPHHCASLHGTTTATVFPAGAPRRISASAATVESAPASEAQSSNGTAKQGPTVINGQILHSIEPARLDVINSLEREGWVERELMKMLKPVEKSWQPADYLPDGADPDFLDKV